MMIPLILFDKWAMLKFSHDNNKNDDLAITIARLFLSKQTSKQQTLVIYWQHLNNLRIKNKMTRQSLEIL